MSTLFDLALDISRSHAESFKAGHDFASSEVARLVLRNDALRATAKRLHAQLRALRTARDGEECQKCKGRGYYGFTRYHGDAEYAVDDQPCPECNPDGDTRDAP